MHSIERYILTLFIFLFSTKNTFSIKLPLKLINNTYSKYDIITQITLPSNTIIPEKSNNRTFFRKLTQTVCGHVKLLDNLLLVLEIKLGSNLQKFNVILDTASFILWIPEKNSDDLSLKIENHYDPEMSTTSNKTVSQFNIRYGSGYAEGYYYYDQVKLLPTESVYMLFGSANKTIFDVSGADGIMGLARKYNQNLLSSIFVLKSKGLINTDSFSIKYYENKKSAELIIGEEHPDFRTKNVGSCPLLSKSYYDKYFWTCQLYAISLILKNNYNNSQDFNTTVNTNISVLFDTGTNAIVLPKYFLTFLAPHLSNYGCFRYDAKEKKSYIACANSTSLPDVVIEVGQFYLYLNKSYMYYEYEMDDGSIIFLLNIYFENHVEPAIIGQPFFYEFHTMFDLDNNMLKFYSSDPKKIIKNNNRVENILNNSDDENVYWILSAVIAVLSLVLVVLIGVLIWCICITKKPFYNEDFSSQLSEMTNSLDIRNSNA